MSLVEAIVLKMLGGRGAGGGPPVTYLLGPFSFTAAQPAPLPSPYTEGGAVGSLIKAVDSGNVGSVAGGKLRLSGSAGYGATQYYWAQTGGAGWARLAGRAFRVKTTNTGPGYHILGLYGDTTINTVPLYALFHAGPYLRSDTAGGGIVATPTYGVEYDLWVILRGTGAFLVSAGGDLAAPTLLWVWPEATDATVWLGLTSQSLTLDVDDVSVTDLGAPFDTDYGLATFRTAGPTVGTEWGTREADAVLEFTTNVPAAGDKVVYARYADELNIWIVALNATYVQLTDVVAGVGTHRIVYSHGLAAGTPARVVCVNEGNVWKLYVNNVATGSYTDPNSHLLGNTTYINIFAGVTNFISWPRTVTLTEGDNALVRDRFTDTNGTAIAAHVPDLGGPWVGSPGAWTVQGNKLTSTAVSKAIAQLDAGRADARIATTFRYASGTPASGVVFRYADGANFWLIYLNVGSNGLTIYEAPTGGYIVRSHASFTYAPATDYRVEVLVQGTTVAVTMDGVAVVSYGLMATTLTATRVGVLTDNNAVTTFDDFFVTPV